MCSRQRPPSPAPGSSPLPASGPLPLLVSSARNLLPQVSAQREPLHPFSEHSTLVLPSPMSLLHSSRTQLPSGLLGPRDSGPSLAWPSWDLGLGHFRSHFGQGNLWSSAPFSLQGPAWVLTTHPSPGKGVTPAKGKISEGLNLVRESGAGPALPGSVPWT